MSEDDAKGWLAARWPTAMPRLEHYVSLLLNEAERQSLIAHSTFGSVWQRHIVDSAQLLDLGGAGGSWLDVGSGGGLPGIVLAILADVPITLVEPRRKRVEFLDHCVEELGLDHVGVAGARVEAIDGCYAIVTARAVSSVNDIFNVTEHVVSRETRYVLPRGRSGGKELETAVQNWHGQFHVEQSKTDPESVIAIVTGVHRR